MDLVDDVHLAPGRRADTEVHALDELAHRFDAVVRRGVELDEVVEAAFRRATQFSHTPHGSPSAPRFRQLSARANRRAVVVFPVPRGPEKRYA